MNKTALLDSIAHHSDALLQRLQVEEVRYRMCPVCRCEYVLEDHADGCAYAALMLDIRLLRSVYGRIDGEGAGG